VKVIVDANIIFSAILTQQGKIAEVLMRPSEIEFIAPEFLRYEIQKHKAKISRITKLTAREVSELEYLVTKNINFISESVIPSKTWVLSEKIVASIDINDTPYVAYSKHFRAALWTGDKKLIRGLQKSGFKTLISTDELIEYARKSGSKKRK
jgi:predicted nucleic acid-binding protein